MKQIKGGPGSGRGTLCEGLKRKLNFVHLSSGDLLKTEVMTGSPRSDYLYNIISSGEPVPNAIVDDLLAEAMFWTAEGTKVVILYIIKPVIGCFM